MPHLGAIRTCLPCRNRTPVTVITFGFTGFGGVLVTEVCTCRFPAVQGVKNHDLAELDEVGHSTGLLEFLVESVSRSDHLDVAPELLTQLAHLCKGVEQPGLVAGDPAPLIEDVAELAVEPFRAVCSAAVEQGISALLHPLNGCADLGGVPG